MKINYGIYAYISMPGLSQSEINQCIKQAMREFTAVCNLQWWMVNRSPHIILATKNTTAWAGAAYRKSQCRGTIYFANNPKVNWIKNAANGTKENRMRIFTGLVAHELTHIVLDNRNYRNETGGIPINTTLQAILRKLYGAPLVKIEAEEDGDSGLRVTYSPLARLVDTLVPHRTIITPADWMPD